MARRVNTKFVVILSAALIGVGGMYGGLLLYRRSQDRNPDVVKALAEAAEKAAMSANTPEEKIAQLKIAVTKYAKAAGLTSQNHRSGADALYVHTAELCLRISRETQIQNDAVSYYHTAMAYYNQSLLENPSNREVNQMLLEEQYQYALNQPASFWKPVETLASNLIKIQDGAKPRLYRAEARLALLSPTNITKTAFTAIQEDLSAALKFDSDSGKATALNAQLSWMQTVFSAQNRGLTKADEFNADAQTQRDVALIRQQLIDFLQRREQQRQGRIRTAGWTWCLLMPLEQVDIDIATQLATITRQQYQLTGRRDRSRLDSAIALLNAAYTTDPSKTALADSLGGLYVDTGHPELTEALYKSIIERTPERPEAYFRLASFYQEQGKILQAIASFNDVIKHPLAGGGREATRNQNFQILAHNQLAWWNLELAERSTVNSEPYKNAMKEAEDAMEWLRTANIGSRGLIDLLEGRSLLIKRDFPRAITALRSAEANLTKTKADANLYGSDSSLFQEKYRLTELLLAQANEMQGQLGAALEYINKALEISPDVSTKLAAMMTKGKYLIQLSRFEEARLLMGQVLGETIIIEGDTAKPVFLNEAILPAALVEQAKSFWSLADSMLRKNTNLLPNAMQRAQLEYNDGNYKDAVTDALQALNDPSSNESVQLQAYRIAIIANIRLEQIEPARTLVAQALNKFKQDTTFQYWKAQLDLPGGVKTPADQRLIIEAISDPYDKAIQLASFHDRLKQWDEEIKVLQAAREPFKTTTTFDDREKLSYILDRQFLANMNAVADTKDPAKLADYLQQAQNLVTEIEKLNLDGTDGKIYRGRLELIKTKGKNGLQYLQQAVAQRPDLALTHLALAQAYLEINRLSLVAGGAVSATQVTSALDELRTVIRLTPNNIQALQMAINLLVQKGDSSSMEEARTLLVSGLAMAPHNSGLINFTEFFAEKIDDSIKMREDLLKRQPGDRENLLRLVRLYRKLNDKQMELARTASTADTANLAMAAAQQALNQALALCEQDYRANPDDLATSHYFAQLLVENDRSEKGATKALALYGTFLAKTDAVVRFNALLYKADFFQKLILTSDAIKTLLAAKLITRENPRDEAINLLREAIEIEPADQDAAERRLADLYFDLGKMADAEQVYKQILAKNKSPQLQDTVTRRLIETVMNQDKLAEATTRLDELLKKQPKDIQGLILRAVTSVQQGLKQTPAEKPKALKAAIADLDQVLQLDNGNVKALKQRAMARWMLGDRLDETVLDTVEKDLIQAVNKDRLDYSNRLLLAELYYYRQRYEEASREYREILKTYPELMSVRIQYTNMLKNLAEFQMTLPGDSDIDFVQSLRRLGPLDQLMDEVKIAAQMYPVRGPNNDPGINWVLLYAQTLSLQNKEAEAQTWLQRLHEFLFNSKVINPEVTEAYLGSLLKTKDYAKVVELSTLVIDGNADFIAKNPQYVTFYMKRAAANQALNKPDEAVKDVDRGFAVGVAAASASRNYSPFIAVLNQVSASTAINPQASSAKPILEPELVAERLRSRLVANPTETISKAGLIQMYLILKRPEDALKVVKTLTMSTEDSALQYWVLRQSALVYNQAHQYEAAEKHFKELEKLAPNNVETLNNYAFILADGLKRPKEAITYAERARKLLATRADPSQLGAYQANVLDTLGWAYYQDNNYTEAVAYLSKSIKVQPQAAAYLHLAQAYQKTGKNMDEAQQKCSEGIKLATTRRDTETLAKLQALHTELNSSTKP